MSGVAAVVITVLLVILEIFISVESDTASDRTELLQLDFLRSKGVNDVPEAKCNRELCRRASGSIPGWTLGGGGWWAAYCVLRTCRRAGPPSGGCRWTCSPKGSQGSQGNGLMDGFSLRRRIRCVENRELGKEVMSKKQDIDTN